MDKDLLERMKKASKEHLNEEENAPNEDFIDDFQKVNSGKELPESELDPEADELVAAKFDDLGPFRAVHAVHPKAKYIEFERKFDPMQYKDLIDAKGDFVESIALSGLDYAEMENAAREVIDAETAEELDEVEKYIGTALFMKVPEDAKYVIVELGIDPVFAKDVKELEDFIGE